ncbi:MAG: threonylcarbamoyl-AMP synthase [Spirochaetaceae bacterium]|jgi:L-threonylcarbamoyladenylate synthase|nr:threonylcarbamoyl-AMP synthase [Spirochaetaceae bacterium]
MAAFCGFKPRSKCLQSCLPLVNQRCPKLCPANEENIAKAAGILREGGIAAFPTETVYGLGADIFNTTALARVFEVKKRPFFDPLIAHIAGTPDLASLIEFSRLSETGRRLLDELAKAFWPGPLTLVLPKKAAVPGLATAGLDTVAVRLPANAIAQKLISLTGSVIAAPSANPFGRLSPTRAEHVASGLGNAVDIILDGGAAEIGVESTVLDISGEIPRILRFGGINIEDIERVTGRLDLMRKAETCASPGLSPSHYTPKTPCVLFKRGNKIDSFSDPAAYVFFNRASLGRAAPADNFFFLSEEGSLREAASNLFYTLHEIDKLGFEVIFAEEAPETGLGRAINDRLGRAAEKKRKIIKKIPQK